MVDELSLDLAPVAVDAVYEGLIAIREAGTALLLIEQQIHRALEVADSAVLLSHGSVAWSGPSTEAGTAMEGLLGAASASLGASAGPGSLAGRTHPPPARVARRLEPASDDPCSTALSRR